MSRRADPRLVGGFVLGAVGLVIVLLLLFGRGNLFDSSRTVLAYFPGSVQGLRVGAPVAFQGVAIGQVSEISLTYDQTDQSVHIPVLMQLDTDRVTVVRTDGSGHDEDELEALIGRGLRAQLQLQSVVTGQLFVELAMQPGTPLTRRGGQSRYLEIPAVPSDIQQLEQSLEAMRKSVPQFIERANVLLARMEGILSPANEKAVSAALLDLQTFVGALAASKGNVETTLARVAEVATAADATARSLQRTVAEVEQVIDANKDQVAILVADLERAATSAMRMADQVNNLVAENRPDIREFTSDTLYRLAGAVTDIQRLVDQLTRLTETFQEDPSGFLAGDQTRGVRPR
jgi:paraquat-inducible protein B